MKKWKLKKKKKIFKEDNSIILENQDKKIESLESLDGFKKILSEEKPEIEFTEKSYLNYSF